MLSYKQTKSYNKEFQLKDWDDSELEDYASPEFSDLKTQRSQNTRKLEHKFLCPNTCFASVSGPLRPTGRRRGVEEGRQDRCRNLSRDTEGKSTNYCLNLNLAK